MSWYRFDWDAFVGQGLLQPIQAALEGAATQAAIRDRCGDLLVRLLKAVGGEPLLDRKPGASERAERAVRMLHEALQHVLADTRRRQGPGYWLQPGDGGPALLHGVERVAVNRAPAAALEPLPVIGPVIAQRVVDERLDHGPYAHMGDLVDRVDGIGLENGEVLQTALSFTVPDATARLPVVQSFTDDLRALVERQGLADPLDALEAALETVLMRVLQRRHPDRRATRWDPPAAPAPTLPASEITVLSGANYYYRLQELLAGATERIDVCMFHVALPQPSHPTSRILAALVEAKDRGVAVRVLLDRDREGDPYLSTVINQAAAELLENEGVAVRMDAEDVLLHSKFVLLDDDLTVLGSHNWSAGSYFRFDDLTLAIRSQAVTAAQRQRFDELWTAAT